MAKKKYSRKDFAVNPVFSVARIQLSLYASNGASMQEVADLAKVMQDCIVNAYHLAIKEVANDMTNHPGPPFEDLSDDNPFAGGLDE